MLSGTVVVIFLGERQIMRIIQITIQNFRQRNIPDSFGRCRTPFTISFSRIRFTVSRSDSTSKKVLLGSELR